MSGNDQQVVTTTDANQQGGFDTGTQDLQNASVSPNVSPTDGSQINNAQNAGTDWENQYKTLQGEFTRRSQDFSELQGKYNQLVEIALQARMNETQQTQSQAKQSIWDLPEQQLQEKLNTSTKTTLQELIREEAEKLAESKLTDIRQQLSATQMIVNTNKVQETLNSLENHYGKLENFNDILNRTVQHVTGPGKSAALGNPAEAIFREFRNQMMQEFEKNPMLFAKLGNSAGGNNANDLAKQMAGATTTAANVNQAPHGPMTGNQQQQGGVPLSRQISTYDMPELLGRNFNVMFNEV